MVCQGLNCNGFRAATPKSFYISAHHTPTMRSSEYNDSIEVFTSLQKPSLHRKSGLVARPSLEVHGRNLTGKSVQSSNASVFVEAFPLFNFNSNSERLVDKFAYDIAKERLGSLIATLVLS